LQHTKLILCILLLSLKLYSNDKNSNEYIGFGLQFNSLLFKPLGIAYCSKFYNQYSFKLELGCKPKMHVNDMEDINLQIANRTNNAGFFDRMIKKTFNNLTFTPYLSFSVEF